MDKTNYTVLSLVAIVAVVAVLSMFLQARAAGGITFTSTTGATANAVLEVKHSGGLSVTGNVVADRSSAAPRTADRYDLNDNGRIDEEDAEILGRVIDRVEFCPRNKYCDWDGNNIVDVQDLALLNRKLLEQQLATQPPVQEADSSTIFSIATTGGIA